MGHYSPFWVPGATSTIDEPPGAFTSWSSTLAVLADSAQLHGLLITVSWAINHHFGFPERFPPLTNPRVHLRPGHQHSQFLPILARFMGYYSPFWFPGAVSTIDEPQGAFTSLSSTLAVLAESGSLHGLLITVSWDITNRIGVPKRFPMINN